MVRQQNDFVTFFCFRYRKIISHLGDKSTGERLQQKLAKQLAELLIRTVLPERITASQAVHAKAQNLNFYAGSQKNYFSPASRQEEIILLLMISEVIFLLGSLLCARFHL